ncbi:hypothetical protein KUTeg_005436 [Tegillarca granosa]|uniref:Uncharacterized protein n=1 Tax=Tegillarca granosa TaxID=220873 RepID=A0ABQ9FNL9_TEGGR|nr:hypothetical protein KUTeg_005436 [Tegillarca granosa]
MDIPPDISVSFTHPDISGDISYVVNEYFDQSISDVKSRRHHRSSLTESDSCDDNDNQDEYECAAASIDSSIVQSRIRDYLSSQSDADDSSTMCTGSDMSDAELASVHSHSCKAGCIKKLDAKRVLENRLNMQELEKGERDLIILGQLQACGLSRGDTTGKGDRKRHRFSYQFDNETVCADCFIYINNISSKYLKNLRKHLYTHRVVPRTHGNKGEMPHNALKYEDVKNIVQFLIGYADRYGMPQPYSRGVNDIIPPIYLPAKETYTCDSIHKKYLDVAGEMDFRSVSESTFRSLWKQCVPHVQFMRARTDVCHICENYRKELQEADTEDEKLNLAQSFAEHIQKTQTERDYYKQRCKAAEAEHKSGIRGEDMKCIHYTFDFAQPVLVPGHVRQEDALYYKSPLKKVTQWV